MPKIALLSTGHPPKDDRIFHKFAKSLTSEGHTVEIITSTANLRSTEGQISFNCFFEPEIHSLPKLKKLTSLISAFAPDAIICSEPFALFTAFLYSLKSKKKPKLLLDVTEWYPENVSHKKKGLSRFLSFSLLYMFNILIANLAKGLIIGEILKKKRYDIISPFRKKIIVSYYPPLRLFNYTPKNKSEKSFTICFTGLLTRYRGFERVLSVAQALQEKNPDTTVHLKLIGKFTDDAMRELYSKTRAKLKITLVDWVSYESFPGELAEADVCLDLRDTEFVYNNSLPIKIFEYLACGKPVIYSRLKSLTPLFTESQFGFMVSPDDIEETLKALQSYLNDPDLLKFHAKNGRELIERCYNWETEEKKLISFLQ
ncbi:MAG: glycosyltransferase family 4 protein [Ignavibacteriaceae bacterium]